MGKTLHKKVKFISKSMTSENDKQIITIHMLPNTLRIKSNQTLKFSRLIEHNMRHIFLEKSCTKSGGEASPRPFSKKSKLSTSLDQQSEMLYSLFLLYVQVEVYQNSPMIAV